MPIGLEVVPRVSRSKAREGRAREGTASDGCSAGAKGRTQVFMVDLEEEKEADVHIKPGVSEG